MFFCGTTSFLTLSKLLFKGKLLENRIKSRKLQRIRLGSNLPLTWVLAMNNL